MATEKKAKTARPSNDPQTVSPEAWYYESRGSIEMIRTVSTTEGGVLHTHTKIPWRMLIESARRCRPELFEEAAKL